MSFTSVGSLGTASSKTAGATLSMSPSSVVPVGNLIVVWVAWKGDRNYTDSSGIRDQSLGCVDDAGNIYTELQSGLYDVSDSMFITYVTEPLTTSSVITIAHRSSLMEAKAMSAWEFTIGTGKRFGIYLGGITSREDPSGGDPRGGSLVTGSLDSGVEHLFLHCMANLRPSTDSYTWDSDYTQIDSAGTTGGADSSNVTLRGGFRIATITLDTVDISNDTADTTDMWQGFVAIREVAYDGVFPTFPNFDDFNRADEDPLQQPPWDQSSTHGPGYGSSRLRVVSNQCARSNLGFGHGSMFWEDPIPAGDDGEVFVTIAILPAASGACWAHCFSSGSGHDSTLAGYIVGSFGFSDARPDAWPYGNTGFNGDQASRGVYVWADRANGNKMGMQFRKSGVEQHLWLDLGSGWRWVSCLINASLSLHNGGYFGLNFDDDMTTRLDDFGGGTSSPGMGQFIRRPWETQTIPPLVLP